MRLRLSLNCAGEIRGVSLPDIPRAPKVVAPAAANLVSSSEFQDGVERATDGYTAGYGRVSSGTTFGKAAKTAVREMGALVDAGDIRKAVFLTGTLPGSTVAAVEALAAWSGYLVAILKQWLRDQFPQSRAFGVWEYQKRGALHLHCCVQMQSQDDARRLKRAWKARWIELLDLLCEKSGVDLYEMADGGSWRDSKWVTRTDAQTVEKSVRCYLSKYLSKGADAVRGVTAFPPSRWWFYDRRLLQEARKLRLVLEVPQLSLADVRTLTVKAASWIAKTCQITFAYESPLDARVKGCIGYASPVASSLLYDSITALLRCLSPNAGMRSGCEVIPLREVALFFGGALVDSG